MIVEFNYSTMTSEQCRPTTDLAFVVGAAGDVTVHVVCPVVRDYRWRSALR